MRKQKKPLRCSAKNAADQAEYAQGGRLTTNPATHATASCRQKQQSPLSWALSLFRNPAVLGLTQQLAKDFADRVHRLSAIQMMILRQALFGLVTVITDQWFSLFVINT